MNALVNCGLSRFDSALDGSADPIAQVTRLAVVGEYALGIAHDFANILTVVHANATMLAMHHTPDVAVPMSEELRDIIASARRGSEMIQRLIQFVRQEPMNAPPIPVDAAVEALARQVRALLPAHVTLDVDIPAIPFWIRAEVSQIEEIVLNLATNARDAMPSGGTVHLSVSAGPDEGVHDASSDRDSTASQALTITVRDTGCGIDAATRGRMFEPFFTTKRAGNGLGIGLSMTRVLVQQLSGRIEVESELGMGTTMKIVLPLERAIPQSEDVY